MPTIEYRYYTIPTSTAGDVSILLYNISVYYTLINVNCIMYTVCVIH